MMTPSTWFDAALDARAMRSVRQDIDDASSGAVVMDIPSLGILDIDGAEATDFLQGQFSNDVKALTPGRGQWTTYSSPKGRLLATLFLLRNPVADPAAARYLALLARDLVEPIRKRLSMFVLRAKAVLSDATPGHSIIGIGGPGAAIALTSAFGAAPEAGHATVQGDTVLVHWPDGRFVLVTPDASAHRVLDSLSRHATPVANEVWAWLGVRAGVPMITAATQDQFVAQTANWDALGGLNFRKGCFTGQEIVARMQYLGRLKERLFAFRTAGDPPAPGTRLFGAKFGDQASGTVVNSAHDPDFGSRFLAVAHIEAAKAGPMTIGAPDGPQALPEPLPYELPAPAPPRGRAGA